MVDGLYYISGLTGAVLIIGSLFLISKRVILLDAQTKEQITEISILGLTLKTNLPVIAMLTLGVILLIFPIERANDRDKHKDDNTTKQLRRITLSGEVDYSEPLKVYVIVAEQADIKGSFNFEVPLSQCSYTVAYWGKNGTSKLLQEAVTLTGNEKETAFKLKGYRGRLEDSETSSNLTTVRAEPESVVGSFKQLGDK